MFHGKCAYCESRMLAVQPADIEHFRPKAKVDGEPGSRGYYWLAAAWENLLASCIFCNRPNRHQRPNDPEKKTLVKANQFPPKGKFKARISLERQSYGGNACQIPPISHLLETSLYVANLSQSKEFYQRIFGFDTLLEDGRMCALRVPGSGLLLLFKHDGSLHPSHTPGGPIPPHGGNGQLHLCFAIPLASLENWSAHLENQGVALESLVRQTYGGISLYFRDPDGHSVEVATPGLWANY